MTEATRKTARHGFAAVPRVRHVYRHLVGWNLVKNLVDEEASGLQACCHGFLGPAAEAGMDARTPRRRPLATTFVICNGHCHKAGSASLVSQQIAGRRAGPLEEPKAFSTPSESL